MSFQHITVDHLDLEGGKGKTAVITLNRPERGNALTKDAKKEIVQGIRQGNRDGHTRSFILAAQGKIFCSGQDLNDRTIQGGNQSTPTDLGQTLVTEWIPLIQEIRHSPRPVIAAVGGTCAGAGLSLALSCDLLVARPGAKFISGFSKLGLAPDAGSNFTLVRALGYQRTLAFFLLNTPLTSEDLHRVGLVNDVREDVLEGAKDVARKVNALAPTSVQMIKKNAREALQGTYGESLEREVATQRFLGNSSHYREGLAAFFEKRKPQFTDLA